MDLLDIFSKNKSPKFTDFSSVAVDIHSHLIPGIDDGSKDMEESIEMIKKFYHLGYKKFITTPHVITDSYNNTPEIVNDGLERLKKALKTTGLPVEIEVAGEYLIDDHFDEKLKAKTVLTIGKKYVLVELPFIQEPENFKTTVFNLQVSGYRVILAHPERYTYWYGNMNKVYEELRDRNIYFQLNLLSLTGYYSIPVKKASEWLIDHEMISFLGTDAHNLGYIENITKALDEKYLQKLLNSGKLMNSSLLYT